jgi:uncharacterized membrane protein
LLVPVFLPYLLALGGALGGLVALRVGFGSAPADDGRRSGGGAVPP